MRILTTKTAGFCMGVRRAVDLALNQQPSSHQKIFTLGPLIHNDQTLELLQSRGVGILKEDQTNLSPSCIVTRAHGIPPQTQEALIRCGHMVVDGTCPRVKTVHKIIEKYRDQGFAIVIAGDAGHAEVIGLLGYAGKNVHLLHSVHEVHQLPSLQKVCLVSQTTFDSVQFDVIAQALLERFPEVVVKKTICSATEIRQTETRNLAKIVDGMIVVGGKNSANTVRLAAIAREHTPVVQHVETEDEIDWNSIKSCKKLGITAGASTPQWMVKRVMDHLDAYAQSQREGLLHRIRRGVIRLANLNVYAALGAVAMYYTSCLFQGLPLTGQGALITFLYFLSIHLWNSLASVEQMQHLGFTRYRFYRSHASLLRTFSVLCMLVLLGVSFFEGRALFMLMSVATLAGLVYHFTFIKKIPTSRDLFAALAWSVLITFIPHATSGDFEPKLTTVFFFVVLFFMAYFRSLMFDLRDIEGDRIFGRETLVTILGERRVHRIMRIALWFCFFALIAFSVGTFLPHQTRLTSRRAVIFLLQIPVLIYIWLVMQFYHHVRNRNEALFALLADGQFFVAGLGAWLAQIAWAA